MILNNSFEALPFDSEVEGRRRFCYALKAYKNTVELRRNFSIPSKPYRLIAKLKGVEERRLPFIN